MIQFDPSISFGALVTLVTILIAGLGFYWRQVYDSKRFKEDIVDIKTDLKQLNDIIIKLALQTQRMDTLEHEIYEMKHGKGFVR